LVGVALDGNVPSASWVLMFFSTYLAKGKTTDYFSVFSRQIVLLKAHLASVEVYAPEMSEYHYMQNNWCQSNAGIKLESNKWFPQAFFIFTLLSYFSNGDLLCGRMSQADACASRETTGGVQHFNQVLHISTIRKCPDTFWHHFMACILYNCETFFFFK